jgi:NAD(P)-dependent dehydrogenase (short-subunit alcohol dehydrogenase family)
MPITAPGGGRHPITAPGGGPHPIAIVTGASRGFGRALALDLAAGGWDVVADARGAEVEVLARRHLHPIQGDVADAAHRADLVAAAAGRGGLDLLVLNAGTLGPTPLPRLATVDLDDVAATIAVNAIAQLGLVQAALPLLRASAGTVVVVTSDAAVEGYEGWGAYGASKAAVEQLANVLAAEEPGIRVYRFDPGDMRTQMHQDAFPGEDITDRPEPEAVIPALRRLLRDAPPSGRYTAASLRELVP